MAEDVKSVRAPNPTHVPDTPNSESSSTGASLSMASLSNTPRANS
jgi:hypothetical protein